MGRSLSTPELNAGVSNIASAAGFAAGDYVYQQRTDTGPVPAGALSTGAFAYNNIPSSTFPSSSTASSDLVYEEINGGTYASQCAARLNNGNIVIGYTRNTPGTYLATTYFKIVNSAGATVVAETAVSGATVAGWQQVAVCTLPNNNFVVVWSNQQATTSWYMTYRIYSEAGVAVTAATTSTLYTFFANSDNQCVQLKVRPRSDNSFIMMGIDMSSGNAIFFAGTQSGFLAPFNGATGYYARSFYNSMYQFIDFVITSDDRINIFYSANAVRIDFDIRNADGTSSSSGVFTNNVSGIYALACCLLPSGTINVVSTNYGSTSGGIELYSWNGTVATYVTRLVNFPTQDSQEVPLLHAYTQGASGNFTIFYNHYSATSGALAYQTFSSSGTLLSNSIASTIPSISYPIGGRTVLSVFDVGSSTRVYMSNRQNSNQQPGTSTYIGNARGIFYFSYNSTSYVTNKVSTANYTYGSQGSFPLGAYVKSASTPIEASFTIGATGTYAATVEAGTNLINKVVVQETTAYAISTIQLQNGNFAIAYVTATNELRIRVYNPAGVQVNSIIASSTAGTGCRFCGMAPFSNGNFAIVYQSTTTATLLYKIYNPSLVEQFAGTVTTTASLANQIYKPQMCVYGDGNQVAIAYRLSTASNYHEIKELTSSNVLTTINTGATLTDVQYMQLVPYRGPGFGFIFKEGGATRSQYQFLQVWKTGATTWTLNGPSNLSGTDDNIIDQVYGSAIPAPNNNSISIVNSGDTRFAWVYNFEPVFSSNATFNRFNASPPNSNFYTDSNTTHALGYTGNGAGVWAVTAFQNSANRIYYTNVRSTVSNWGSIGTGPIYNSGLTTSSTPDFRCISVAPHVEGAAVIAFIDGSTYPAFFVPVVQRSIISQTLTAGTDISTSKLSLTPEAGYVLRGVALTTASAGGSGLVQTKGVASVSASYQSITPTMNFDFRISTANGVRGSITGRTVTLEG